MKNTKALKELRYLKLSYVYKSVKKASYFKTDKQDASLGFKNTVSETDRHILSF